MSSSDKIPCDGKSNESEHLFDDGLNLKSFQSLNDFIPNTFNPENNQSDKRDALITDKGYNKIAKWTLDENIKLLKLFKIHENKWAVIANYFDNQNYITVKNQTFNITMSFHAYKV